MAGDVAPGEGWLVVGAVTERVQTKGVATETDAPPWPRRAPRVLLGVEVLWRWVGASIDWDPTTADPGSPARAQVVSAPVSGRV